MKSKNKPSVFISYAREDQEQASKLYVQLKQYYCTPWIDIENLLPGDQWEIIIPKIIEQSDFFLACLSRTSSSKIGFFQTELKHGYKKLQRYPSSNTYIIPIRLDDCEVPEEIKHLTWVNLYESNGISKLIAAIKTEWQRRGKEWISPELFPDRQSSFKAAFFSGKYYLTIRPEGIVTLPKPFHKILLANYSNNLFMSASPYDKCISLYAEEEFFRRLEKIKTLPISEEDELDIARKLISSAKHAVIRDNGYIFIPEEYRTLANLTADIVMVGMLESIELWDRQEWEAVTDISKVDKHAMFSKLAQYGIW